MLFYGGIKYAFLANALYNIVISLISTHSILVQCIPILDVRLFVSS